MSEALLDVTQVRIWSGPDQNRPRVDAHKRAQGGNRTRDLRITSALLYRLSYLGAGSMLAVKVWAPTC